MNGWAERGHAKTTKYFSRSYIETNITVKGKTCQMQIKRGLARENDMTQTSEQPARMNTYENIQRNLYENVKIRECAQTRDVQNLNGKSAFASWQETNALDSEKVWNELVPMNFPSSTWRWIFSSFFAWGLLNTELGERLIVSFISNKKGFKMSTADCKFHTWNSFLIKKEILNTWCI